MSSSSSPYPVHFEVHTSLHVLRFHRQGQANSRIDGSDSVRSFGLTHKLRAHQVVFHFPAEKGLRCLHQQTPTPILRYDGATACKRYIRLDMELEEPTIFLFESQCHRLACSQKSRFYLVRATSSISLFSEMSTILAARHHAIVASHFFSWRGDLQK